MLQLLQVYEQTNKLLNLWVDLVHVGRSAVDDELVVVFPRSQVSPPYSTVIILAVVDISWVFAVWCYQQSKVCSP